MIGVLENKIFQVIEKFRQIEVEISAEKGDFTLFALVEREDSLGKWDVVVSASWIGKNEKSLIETIAAKIHKNLSKEEQIRLSRIVVLPPSDSLVRNLNMIGVEHGTVKLSNNTFNGILIKEAYLITSKSH
jgi:hypothetical protein